MAITLTVTESTEQILYGIPKSVTVAADQPCSIFYTLDGSDPTTESNLYLNFLELPTNENAVTLKLYATNVLDQSEIVTRTYSSLQEVTRLPRDTVVGNYTVDYANRFPGFPYGSNPMPIPVDYDGPALLKQIDDPNIPDTVDGYGDQGQPLFNRDEGSLSELNLIYSTSDYLGRTGPGIGNFPTDSTVQPEVKQLDGTVNYFDPRAPVIMLDFTKGNLPPGFSSIQRERFNISDPERFSDGNLLFTTGWEGNRPSCQFIRSHHDVEKGTITNYYFDSRYNKWLITTSKYNKKPALSEGLWSSIVSPSRVYKWIPFFWRKFPN